MVEIKFGQKTKLSKKLRDCFVGIVEMSSSMWAVVVIKQDDELLFSRNFCFTEDTKKIVWESCRKCYRIAKECVYQKRLDDLEELL